VSDDTHPHGIRCSDAMKRDADQIAALLNLDSWLHALTYGIKVALSQAKASAKGDTETLFCQPKVKA